MSEDANEIYMEMSPDCFLRALKTAQVAHWVKMKLTNKHTPCLTVEVEQVATITTSILLGGQQLSVLFTMKQI